MNNVAAAAPFADLEFVSPEDEDEDSRWLFENVPSAEDSYAEREFVSELLSRAKSRCSPKDHDIFCNIVFQSEKYNQLAQKYGCSVSRIRQRYRRAQRVFSLVALDLMHNRQIELMKKESPSRAESALFKAQADMVKSVPHKVKPNIKNNQSRSTLANQITKKQEVRPANCHEDVFKAKTEEPWKTTAGAAQNQQPREPLGETKSSTPKSSEDTDYGCALGCVGLLFVLLLFAGGCWYLYSAVTPSPKGVSFERVIIESTTGALIAGEIQSDLQIDSGKGLHQVSLSLVNIISIRPKPGIRQRLRSKDDSLSVCLATTAGTHLEGIISRWVTFKHGDSYKYMDLLKVKEIRSDFICGDNTRHATFSVRFEKLPPLTLDKKV